MISEQTLEVHAFLPEQLSLFLPVSMVFNILVNNDDDHLRNHGFVLMESPEQTPVRGAQEPQCVVNLAWRISPLYDVVREWRNHFEEQGVAGNDIDAG